MKMMRVGERTQFRADSLLPIPNGSRCHCLHVMNDSTHIASTPIASNLPSLPFPLLPFALPWLLSFPSTVAFRPNPYRKAFLVTALLPYPSRSPGPRFRPHTTPHHEDTISSCELPSVTWTYEDARFPFPSLLQPPYTLSHPHEKFQDFPYRHGCVGATEQCLSQRQRL
jgi:hypothetical protein